jgi:hypothetical protein
VVPREVTAAVVGEELPALRAYAGRHGWQITWDEASLVLLADGSHPADGSPARLHADLAGYRALPPAWTFIPHNAEAAVPGRFPAPGPLPGGVGSIFHTSRLICAPFNRLAYQQHGGPHQNWGRPAAWLDVRGHVRATRLGEMLAQIVTHLNYSRGWQP